MSVLIQIASIIFGLMVGVSSPTSMDYIPLSQWEAQVGDRFIADTEQNIGFIVHTDGRYTSMRIGSGKREIVNYLGKTYDATTPASNWTVNSLHIQPDRQTFGASGRFMRLYIDGEQYTSYGIHSVQGIEDMLAEDDRYESMGCILVHDDVLDILYETYELNGNSLDVVTVNSFNLSALAKNTP